MIEYKQSVAAWVPVRIFNTNGDPVTGVVFGGVTATVQKSNGSTTQSVTVGSGEWSEITTGAFSGAGVYALKLSSGNLDTTGYLTVAVATSGNKTYVGAIKVVANEEADTYARIGAPTGASVSADVATLLTNVGLLKKYEEGRWKIHISGPDANRLVIYDTDDVTPLFKFDLKDSGGSATFVNPFERVPFP